MSNARSVSLTILLAAGTAAAQPTPDPNAPPPADTPAAPAPEQPAPAPAPAPEATPAPAPTPAATKGTQDEDAPTSFKIGSAYFTPIGFMDFTGVWRDSTNGSGIGTNFGSIPYGVVFGHELSETRFSMQNSRLGLRIDVPVKGAKVLGYMEADFLGNAPGNLTVSSNSNTLRSRLYFVDIKKSGLEVLAGQTWSLITPGRTGISPIPGDLFYTNNIDVNYQAGLFWGRIPELRFAYHNGDLFHAAIALDSPEQYIGGSAGGSQVTLPAALAALGGTQLNNGTTTTGTPNVAPDVIAKVAIDPVKQVHLEAGGLERQFRVWMPPNASDKFSATGVGGFLNANAEVVHGLRVVTANLYGTGVGRYIFGQAPDIALKPDGHPVTIDAFSTVSGLEVTVAKTLLYGYYGGIYIGKQEIAAMDGTPCTDAMSCVGYGYAGSPSGQNKWIHEGTLGFTQTFWKDPKWGALQLMGQYSYLRRDPYFTAPGTQDHAHINMVFFNLRYALPGAPPKLPD